MNYLIDTNVLIRFSDPAQALRPMVRAAIGKLLRNRDSLYVTSRYLIEFWHVATRPLNRRGLGLGLADAERQLKILERVFQLIPDSHKVHPQWRRLVITYGVAGVKVFDAHLVAAMIAHGDTHILTFNLRDFARYAAEGIVAVDPSTV